MKQLGAALLVLFIAVAILWYLRGQSKAPFLASKAAQPAMPLEVLKSPSPKPSAQSAPSTTVQSPLLSHQIANQNEATPPSDSAPAPAPLDQVTPSISTLREEVKKDPHTTPQSLLRFGLAVGQRMEKALASETAANAFLNELEGCLGSASHEVPQAAQALCIESARDLAKKYPNLNVRAEKLAAQADPSVARLVH